MKKTMLLLLLISSFIMVGCGKETITYLECQSDVGNITLYYNSKNVYDYAVSNSTFDIDVAHDRVAEYGLEEYLKRFQSWFEETGTIEDISVGICEAKQTEQ